MRSRVVLGAAEGLRNTEIAERLGITRAMVGKWRAGALPASAWMAWSMSPARAGRAPSARPRWSR